MGDRLRCGYRRPALGILLGAALERLVGTRLAGGVRAARRLDVYVTAHCFTCAEARRMAAAAARVFPDLVVRTIDVGAATQSSRPDALPAQVVAVPAYVLDGAVIALGNPNPEQLFARIAASLLQSSRDVHPPRLRACAVRPANEDTRTARGPR